MQQNIRDKLEHVRQIRNLEDCSVEKAVETLRSVAVYYGTDKESVTTFLV